MPTEDAIDSERRGSVDLLRLSGSLDGATSEAVREALSVLFGEGRAQIVLDLREVRFIDSSGLSALVGSVKAARRGGGDIILAGLAAPVRSIFQVTRLDKVFRIEDDPESACSSFEQ